MKPNIKLIGRQKGLLASVDEGICNWEDRGSLPVRFGMLSNNDHARLNN